MKDSDAPFPEELNDILSKRPSAGDKSESDHNPVIRRRIEDMRELRRLRELLDDPEFDDFG